MMVILYSCSKSYLEGDLALNDGYVVAAILNKNWPTSFWTISIFVSTDRGNSWSHVKDLIRTFTDGGNAWFFRGIISKITGIKEVVRGEVDGVLNVSKGLIELKDVGKVYSIDGRLVFRGKGRVVLPRGVYFVKFKGRVFKVIVK